MELAEVWHWSWLDRRWTTPRPGGWPGLPSAIPVGGSDWHRPGDLKEFPAVPGYHRLLDDSGATLALVG